MLSVYPCTPAAQSGLSALCLNGGGGGAGVTVVVGARMSYDRNRGSTTLTPWPLRCTKNEPHSNNGETFLFLLFSYGTFMDNNSATVDGMRNVQVRD